MASETVNPRLLKSNIDLLARVTKKPNMVTEKALSRPPFKFLHDLITLIVKTTGYLRGLFSEDEFNFEYVKDNKESKLAFLDKLIDAIGFINGKGVDVKSAKIVAGAEVEKTNKLLNELAKAVLDKKPFVDAVEKVRKGQKPPEAATTSTAASTSKAAAAPAKKAAATASTAASKAPTKAAPAPAARGKAAAATKGPAQTKASGPAGKAPAKAAASKTKTAEPVEKQPRKPATPEPEPEDSGSLEVVVESEKSFESSSKSLEPVETIETPQELNDVDKIDDIYSKPNSANVGNLQSVEPMAVNNNLDKNLDQLVAGLGLDDDDEEDEEGLAENAIGEGRQPEDSGIDSSSKSSSNHSASQNNNSAKSESPQASEMALSAAGPSEVSPPQDFDQLQETAVPRATDRKRSATIKSSRRAPSKSGIPNNNNSGMINGNGSQLLSRSQNVPSSAAPMSYATAATALPPNIPPPPYEESSVLSPQAPPPSAAVQQRMNTAQRTSARPSSSRPAPPRVKTASRSRPQLGLLAENRVGEQVAAATDQQFAAKADQQQVWPPPEVLALDLDLDDREDGEGGDKEAAAAADEYVMSSQKLQEALLSMDSGNGTADLGASLNSYSSSNNQGRLVQQLMETKSELEGNVAAAKKMAAAAADSSLSSTDTKVLRERVQVLCQSVGGLSKALNYLHEDVEPMVSELAKWREEYRANSRAVERLQTELAKAVDPLRRELETVELEVRHASEQLINAKAAVHRNALTIARMIEGV